MRVLIVNTSEKTGGAAVAANRLMEALNNNGVKAKMLTVEQVSELIGHEVGGVCPYGIKEGVKVYLDESLKRFDVVYPACGSSNSAVKLSIPDLEKSCDFEQWVDVCKLPQ